MLVLHTDSMGIAFGYPFHGGLILGTSDCQLDITDIPTSMGQRRRLQGPEAYTLSRSLGSADGLHISAAQHSIAAQKHTTLASEDCSSCLTALHFIPGRCHPYQSQRPSAAHMAGMVAFQDCGSGYDHLS